MNQRYFLRVEGVNLDATLSDTSQISVIRGGSLLLRNAMTIIAKNFTTLRSISNGASVGLFEFTAQTQVEADELCQAVANRLNTHPRLQHLTFVVDIQPDSHNFLFDKEAILARNRFRQMQQLSLAIPKENRSMGMAPCALDNLRPASRSVSLQEETQQVSQSVYDRLIYGRRQKRQFYRDETKRKLNFIQDFQELARWENTDQPLQNKIAVLFFDGNKFGDLQRKYCPTVETMCHFDKEIQEKRRSFLTNFLDKMRKDPAYLTAKDQLRLETLLWGGDEMMFVVPAWKGLDVLNFFYAQSQTWTFCGERLTHAGGIVFCQANAPIHRMKKLAEDLAKEVKDRPEGREKNLFDYIVLESIDYPTEPLKPLRQRRFGEKRSQDRQPLAPFTSPELQESVKRLKERIPKSQIYAIVRAILACDDQDIKEAFFLFFACSRLAQVTGYSVETFTTDLEKLFPQHPQPWQWIHFMELWDYWMSE